MGNKLNSFDGAEARNWRRKLAASAMRSDDTIRTLKFPLDIENASIYWPAAVKLHQTVASDEEGSLIRFLGYPDFPVDGAC